MADRDGPRPVGSRPVRVQLTRSCALAPREPLRPSGPGGALVEPLDAAAARIARRQHALITRSQALDAGFSPMAIQRRRRSGRWVDMGPGVYLINGAAVTWETKVMAACLATGGAASHRTAAALKGLRGFPKGRV